MPGAGGENSHVEVGVVLEEDWPGLNAELVTRDTGVTPVGAVTAATNPIQLQSWQISVPFVPALPASTPWAIGMAR